MSYLNNVPNPVLVKPSNSGGTLVLYIIKLSPSPDLLNGLPSPVRLPSPTPKSVPGLPTSALNPTACGLYSPSGIPIAPSVPGTISLSSKPSPSDVNTNCCTSGFTSITSAVNPPSAPSCSLITSANASTGVSGLAGPALSNTICGGCLQSITLLAEAITLAPKPGPSNL